MGNKVNSFEEMKMLLPTLNQSVPDEISQRILAELKRESINHEMESKLKPINLKKSWNKRTLLLSSVAGLLIALMAVVPSIPAVQATQSNTMAQTLLAWLHGTSGQRWVSKVDTPVTNHGITMTITDILYDQNQVQIGYTVFGEKGTKLGLVYDSAKIRINGEEIHPTWDGSETPTSYGYEGVVSLVPHNSLPKSGDLQIMVSKIGNTSGEWAFKIPVSATKLDKNEIDVHPMKLYQYKALSILVTDLTITPSTTELTYQVTGQTDKMQPLLIDIRDENKHLLDSVSGGEIGKPEIVNGAETVQYRATYNTSVVKPKKLILEPSFIGEKTLSDSFAIRIQN